MGDCDLGLLFRFDALSDSQEALPQITTHNRIRDRAKNLIGPSSIVRRLHRCRRYRRLLKHKKMSNGILRLARTHRALLQAFPLFKRPSISARICRSSLYESASLLISLDVKARDFFLCFFSSPGFRGSLPRGRDSNVERPSRG